MFNWILSFLSHRIHTSTSFSAAVNTAAPQGCVLSPLLYTQLTRNCVAIHQSDHIIKYADTTTVIGLITNNDESTYRDEVRQLESWYRDNNLSLNVDKTKEVIVDFRMAGATYPPYGKNV